MRDGNRKPKNPEDQARAHAQALAEFTGSDPTTPPKHTPTDYLAASGSSYLTPLAAAEPQGNSAKIKQADGEEREPLDQPEPAEAKDPKKKGAAKGIKLFTRHEARRLLSERDLERIIDWHAEPGASYHVISWGDVDRLTFLKWVLRQQPLEVLGISTWCACEQDIKELECWINLKNIGRLDFYAGEIFQGTYAYEYKLLSPIVRATGGRLAIFRNHSKIFYGRGPLFDFAIAGSGNLNTNPRCENTVITIDTNLMKFYKNYFDGIRSFNREFDDWKPYVLIADRSPGPQTAQTGETEPKTEPPRPTGA